MAIPCLFAFDCYGVQYDNKFLLFWREENRQIFIDKVGPNNCTKVFVYFFSRSNYMGPVEPIYVVRSNIIDIVESKVMVAADSRECLRAGIILTGLSVDDPNIYFPDVFYDKVYHKENYFSSK